MNNSIRSGLFGARPARVGGHRAGAGAPAGLLLLLSLALPAPVRAQTEKQQFGFGTHALRRILYETKFKALDDWNNLADKPGETLLVLLGAMRGRDRQLFLDRIPGKLENFVRR